MHDLADKITDLLAAIATLRQFGNVKLANTLEALVAERDAAVAERDRLREALVACVSELTELYGEVLADTKRQGRERVENDPVLIAARAALTNGGSNE